MEKSKGRIQDKVAIVTGGASGIGAETAALFAREGGKVIVADINEKLGAEVVERITKAGGIAHFLRADMGKMADIKATIDFAVTTYDRLDVLVNNAAIESSKPEVDTSEEEYDAIMNVNVKGVFFATKFAVPVMIKNGGGSIINLSSVYGLIGSQGYAAYHASKGAVRLLTKSTAIAHARKGIRANSIHPGAIDTPLLRKTINSMPDPVAAEAAFINGQPAGYLGHPIEIAYGCLFLASDESKFVMGTELVIDGGMVAN